MSDDLFDNGLNTLKKNEAMTLWSKGRDEWNQWVKDNPEYNIDFSGVLFSVREVSSKNNLQVFPFEGFNFPSGVIKFQKTRFVGRNLEISFKGANFASGSVFFDQAAFEGEIAFNDIVMEDGQFSFLNTDFPSVDISFQGANFGNSTVYFGDVDFNDGHFSFSDVTLNSGTASFYKCNFGKGEIDFGSTSFGKSDVHFEGTVFNDAVFFTDLKNPRDIEYFTFKYSVFNGPLDINTHRGEPFGCLIDLTHTKVSHHVSLAGVKCIMPREPKRTSFLFPQSDWVTQKIAVPVVYDREFTDDEDYILVDQARRLKELAESNKDHDRAKEFHILEMQAERKFAFPYDFLFKSEFWYELLSDYGRSITRPLGFTCYITAFFALIYCALSLNSQITDKAQTLKVLWLESLLYSASQMFAFIPSSRAARNEMENLLFCASGKDDCLISPMIYGLTFTQSTISLLLLFLLGLGLRNRYRI